MKTVGSHEAKTHLSGLLKRAARGERITITRYGVPVAVLVPAESLRKENVEETIEAIKQFRKGRMPDGLSISGMIRQGRRW